MSENPDLLSAMPGGGLRERKRIETRQRIAEAGLRLFLANGYEATTLDAVAMEAGISRRTFFLHFKSKDDIIFAWQRAGWSQLRADLLKTSPDIEPLTAVRDAMVKHISQYSAEQMTTIDDLMRSSESLMARKPAFYAEQEHELFVTLCEVWRQPARRAALRMVAMASIGALRLGIQDWYDQPGQKKPMSRLVRESFQCLISAI
jgi:AcrR family transcriptional regulator